MISLQIERRFRAREVHVSENVPYAWCGLRSGIYTKSHGTRHIYHDIDRNWSVATSSESRDKLKDMHSGSASSKWLIGAYVHRETL